MKYIKNYDVVVWAEVSIGNFTAGNTRKRKIIDVEF